MISALSSYLPTGTSFKRTSPLSSDKAKWVIVVSPAGIRYTEAHDIGFEDLESLRVSFTLVFALRSIIS